MPINILSNELLLTISKIHIIIILLSVSILSVCIEIKSHPPSVKEIDNLSNLFTEDISKTYAKHNTSFIDSIKIKIEAKVNLSNFKYINWKKDIPGSRFIQNIRPLNSDIIQNSQIYYIDKIIDYFINNDNYITYYPIQINSCDSVIGSKQYIEQNKLIQIKPSFIEDLKYIDSSTLYLSVIDYYINPKNKNKVDLSLQEIFIRNIYCKCQMQIDTLKLLNYNSFRANFTEIEDNRSLFRNMTINEVRDLLIKQNRDKILSRRINLLGVDMSVKLLGSTVIAIIITIFVYLISYLRELKKELIKDNKNNCSWRSYTWIGLFPNIFAIIFTFITLVVIPFLGITYIFILFNSNILYKLLLIIGIIIITYTFIIWIKIRNNYMKSE